MQNYKEYFKGKKITMMGLGLLGRGLNDARFFAECGADLTVTDLKTEDDLKPTLKKLAKYKNIKYVLGGHQFEDFKDRDFILKAAGVPLHSVYIEEARKNNIPVKMDASWFAELSPETMVIGVTGTRGKSTVTHLIYHILKTAGQKVHFGGNVRGLATLPLLGRVKKGDIAIMELDSWQLQGFGEASISPHISVFTNILSDHLNYYLKGSKDEKEAEQRYFEDKAKIYLNQKKDDFLICGEKISARIGKIKGQKIITSKKLVPKNWKVKIPGEHNLENISCAITAARALKIDEKIIKKGVESFTGIPGRLELVRELKGVKIFNDTNSTTPDAAIVALKALGEGKKKKIVLIMGGSDKGLDTSKLVKEIKKYCKAVFLLDGTGSANMNIEAVRCKDLKEAVTGAMKVCKKGDILLFSPAFASFGMFINEYDRGEKFNKLIKSLK